MSIRPFELDDGIIPSTRLSERRSGIITPSTKKKVSMGLCFDCQSSIYDNQKYHKCNKCNTIICYNCLQYNTRCTSCNATLYTTDYHISHWVYCTKIIKFLFCLPNRD